MSDNQLSLLDGITELPWGTADKQRGLPHKDKACDFIATFPIGTKVSTDDFDRWGYQQGYLKVPAGYKKSSDAWKAHLFDRHKLISKLNKAGCHPRMDRPFTLVLIQKDYYEVVAAHEACRKSRGLPRLASCVKLLRLHWSYYLQSVHWEEFPPYYRDSAKSVFYDVETIDQQVRMIINRLVIKLENEQRRIESYNRQDAKKLPPKGGSE